MNENDQFVGPIPIQIDRIYYQFFNLNLFILYN